MIPAFVSDDYLRSRVALPYGKPIDTPNVFGIEARHPYIKRPFRLQPMPINTMDQVASTKGYFLGGLLTSDADLKAFAERERPKSIGQRVNDFESENKDFLRSLLSLYRQ
jgi:hypothetical protein